jgi:hypothetical protein
VSLLRHRNSLFPWIRSCRNTEPTTYVDQRHARHIMRYSPVRTDERRLLLRSQDRRPTCARSRRNLLLIPIGHRSNTLSRKLSALIHLVSPWSRLSATPRKTHQSRKLRSGPVQTSLSKMLGRSWLRFAPSFRRPITSDQPYMAFGHPSE